MGTFSGSCILWTPTCIETFRELSVRSLCPSKSQLLVLTGTNTPSNHLTAPVASDLLYCWPGNLAGLNEMSIREKQPLRLDMEPFSDVHSISCLESNLMIQGRGLFSTFCSPPHSL